MKVASERSEPIPVYAEMGSVNPVILLPEALATRADAVASGLHVSATMGSDSFVRILGLYSLEKAPKETRS